MLADCFSESGGKTAQRRQCQPLYGSADFFFFCRSVVKESFGSFRLLQMGAGKEVKLAEGLHSMHESPGLIPSTA